MEIWKDIAGFENLYEISNMGKVRSKTGYNGKYTRIGKYIKPGINKNGYYQVSLYKNSKRYCLYLHRLVAKSFIPNPQNLPCVNHIDERKDNNSVENLEWCTHFYNNHYKTAEFTRDKAVKQFSLSGEIIAVFPRIKEAAIAVNLKGTSSITACCRGRRNTAGGYKWQYVK